jgi:hypothetical protein
MGGGGGGWIEMGVFDPAATRLLGDESRSRGEDNEEGETKDRLGHRRTRVRV